MTCQNNTKVVTVVVPVITLSFETVQKKLVLRKWNEDEIPIGALFRGRSDNIQRINGYDPKCSCIERPAIILSGGKYPPFDGHYFLGDLITSISEPEYSYDGINWHRCGTWEEVD